MVTYLLPGPHADTDSMLNDILTYERLNKVRTHCHGSSKQMLNLPTQKNNGCIKNIPSSGPVLYSPLYNTLVTFVKNSALRLFCALGNIIF